MFKCSKLSKTGTQQARQKKVRAAYLHWFIQTPYWKYSLNHCEVNEVQASYRCFSLFYSFWQNKNPSILFFHEGTAAMLIMFSSFVQKAWLVITRMYETRKLRNVRHIRTRKRDCSLPNTFNFVDAEAVPATFRTEQTYSAESEGCKAVKTREPLMTSCPSSCFITWPSLSKTFHFTAGSGNPEYWHVRVTFVPESTSTVLPTITSRDSLLYQETMASDVSIVGIVASVKWTKHWNGTLLSEHVATWRGMSFFLTRVHFPLSRNSENVRARQPRSRTC